MIIICWTNTPLYPSPHIYLCYGCKNLFQCWHLSFDDRSCKEHLQFLSCSKRNIWFDHCSMYAWSIVKQFIAVYKLHVIQTDFYSISSQISLFSSLLVKKTTVIKSRFFYRMLNLVKRNFWMPVSSWPWCFPSLLLQSKSVIIRNIGILVTFRQHI